MSAECSGRVRWISCALALLAAAALGATSCHGSTAGAADGNGLSADAARDASLAPDASGSGPAVDASGLDAGAADCSSADAAGADAAGPGDAGYSADVGRPLCPGDYPNNTVGLIECSAGAFQGYTLFAPIWSTTTYLIDMTGQVVHTWPSSYLPGMSAYLLENGDLLRTAHESMFGGAPTGGGVQRFRWDGTLAWDFTWFGATYAAHHDVAMMPSGNVLILYWEAKTEADVIAVGGTPNGGVWPDAIIEVMPTGLKTGNIVWQWHLWDHLLPAGESPADHPELMQLDYTRNDWLHTNSIAYNPDLDQIVLSSRNLSEFWIIDHGTTTAQAAGHTGGARGHGGDFLYRWGHPSEYGVAADQMLFGQHNVHWIEPGLPGAGNILLFNNGTGRSFSTVDELITPVDGTGSYPAVPTGTPAGPLGPVWSYVGTPPGSFYANHISGAQRLPNGDTLICTGNTGEIFEVTPSQQIVWKYRNPVGEGGPVGQGSVTKGPDIFRAYRYAPDYPGLAGRVLSPGGLIEDELDGGTPDAAALVGDCTTSDDCRECCASINLDGYNKLVDWMTPCICGGADAGPGPCASACQDFFCAPIPPPSAPSQACSDCSTNAVIGGTCGNVLNLCVADPDCQGFQACRLRCPAQ